MFPPIFEIAAADAAVTALIGANPVRLYPFGEAPQNVQLPYVVWQQLGGNPENYLAKVPDADNYSAQIDVYANSPSSARQVAQALRDAYEPRAYITSWNGESRDQETNHYRLGFDVDFIVLRQ